MGYDIFMLNKPIELELGYSPQFNDQPEYFRIDSSGMSGMVHLMFKAGILEVETKEPSIPEFPLQYFSKERAEELEEWFFTDVEPENKPTTAEKELLKPLKTKLESIRKTKPVDSNKVPAFKFYSNIGWIISPEECKIISDGLIKAVADSKPFLGIFAGFLPSKKQSGMSKTKAKEWILNWAAYNATAMKYNGYKVI